MRYAMMTALILAAASARAAAPAKDEGGAGKQIFAKKCSTCHGADGKGKAAMAKMFKIDPAELDLTAEGVSKKPDAELVKTVTDGKNKMPSFKSKLKPEEIAGVLAYVRTLAAPAKPDAPAK